MLQSIAGNPTLGRYTLLRRIAVGGMGEVFLARERGGAGIDRLVVVKRLLRDPLDDGDPVPQFLDEARITAQLSHPNIVQLHELGEEGGELFLAMELVPSQNLGRVLTRLTQQRRRLPLELTGYILVEAARGLAYAHAARDTEGQPLHIVHRDVSPSNILVGYRGEVKLADFGIAKARDRQSRTRTGMIRGKAPYMAPEQIQGRDVDARCDVWALGVVAWEATLGRPLFRGQSDIETIRMVVDHPIPDPTTIDPMYPPAVAAVIMAALDRDLDRRLPGAEPFARMLRDALRASVGIADATELAALMTTAFAHEQRQLEDVRVAAPAPAPEPATVRRPAADLAPTTAPDSIAIEQRATTPRRPRAPVVIAGLIAVALAAVAAVVIARSASSDPPGVAAASVATYAYATPAPDAAGPRTPADAAVADAPGAPLVADAAAAAAPDARPGRDGSDRHREPRDGHDTATPPAPETTPPDRSPAPIDAGTAGDDPAQIRFSVGDGQVAIDGKRYRSGTPRVSPGPHRIEVRLPDGRTLVARLDADAGAVYKCVVKADALTCSR